MLLPVTLMNSDVTLIWVATPSLGTTYLQKGQIIWYNFWSIPFQTVGAGSLHVCVFPLQIFLDIEIGEKKR